MVALRGIAYAWRMEPRYKLTVQTVLPEDYRDNEDVTRDFATLEELGFWGVELNMADPARFDIDDVTAFLDGFGLKLSMYASGLTAKTFGITLSAEDEEVRSNAVEKVRQMIDLVAHTGAGIIFGYMKGPAGLNPATAARQFQTSLAELVDTAAEAGVPLIVEATNRYEATLAHSVDEAWELAAPFEGKNVYILPDTFHMNIEEADMEDALRRHVDHFISFHVSDNNRFFPGLGAIDFAEILEMLKRVGFSSGRLGIEGNIAESFRSDIRRSAELLLPLIGE